MAVLRTNTGQIAFARYQMQRAILENALDRDYTQEDRQAALDYFGGCAFCGSPDAPRNDHLVPVVKLGDFIRQNVVPACQPCDDSKGGEDHADWMRNSTSKRSLRGRRRSEAEIEARIMMIREFVGNYLPRTEEALFGPFLSQYQEILRNMEALAEEAHQLILGLKARNVNAEDTGSGA